MTWLIGILGLVLTVFVGIPVAVVAQAAVLLSPAVAEQVGQDPCSVFEPSTNASLSVDGAQEGGVGFDLPKWSNPRHQSLRSKAQGIPAGVKRLYLTAADQYKVPWQLLAGIGMAETRHGRNNATSSAGAQGLMQFMSATFAAYGVDGNRDGRRDIHNDADSIFSAANYLTKSGVTHGKAGVLKALWAYNHSVAYRNDVLFYAWSYAGKAGRIVVFGDPIDCGDETPSGNPNLPPITSERVAAMFAWGRRQLGERYVLGANGPSAWDCSSFVQGVFRAAGISIPRTARGQRSWLAKGNGFLVKPGSERPGDFVFTNTWLGPNTVGHVMVVYDPASHRSLEAQSKGVGFYRYSVWRHRNIYEIWRLGNLTN